MTDLHLAQLNIATLRAPLDDPANAEFVEMLDPVNRLADEAPGFVWRLRDGDAPDATSIRPYGDDVIINFSVWESREALWNFAYRNAGHMDVMRRRREWFRRHAQPYLVLWWIPAGHTPAVDEAMDRLELLRRNGPGPGAFTFRDFHHPEWAGHPMIPTTITAG